MKNSDLISMALRNLFKRKLRTLLTILGVIMGTASIVVMISIGIGTNKTYENEIKQWGSLQVIEVYPNGLYGETTTPKEKNAEINKEALNKFSNIDGVETVSPVIETSDFLTVCGKYVSDYATVVGILPETTETMGYKVSEGRSLEEGDKKGVLIGGEILNNFYNPKLNWQARYSAPRPEINAFEDKFSLTFDRAYGTNDADKAVKPAKIDVVGVMDANGNNAYDIVMPIKTLENLIKERETYEAKQSQGVGQRNKKKSGVYDRALVKVEDMNEVERVQEQIKEMGYNAHSLNDYLKSMKETSKMLSLMLGAIGAISLAVAAIGIANTMIMSIYERTREIGVMKVIGASLTDIKRLFLTEAAFIGFTGGVFGIIISFGASKLINVIAASETMSYIPLWLYLGSLMFSTLVGVASGYFPAKRAMRLSALEAIKTE